MMLAKQSSFAKLCPMSVESIINIKTITLLDLGCIISVRQIEARTAHQQDQFQNIFIKFDYPNFGPLSNYKLRYQSKRIMLCSTLRSLTTNSTHSLDIYCR